MKNAACFAIAVSVAVGLNTYPGEAQTTLNVNAGQTLTGADLLAGEFNGQTFTLGSDLTIEINDEGELELKMGSPDVSFAGTTVNINDGGLFSQTLSVDFTDATLNILEGGYAYIHSLENNVAVNVQGGLLVSLSDINGGSTVSMSSGRMKFSSLSGDSTGMVNMTGGTLLRCSRVRDGASTTISGGLIAENFTASTGGQVIFVGDEFQLNGVDVTDLEAGLPENGVFTGTLADGSVFIFNKQAGDDDLYGSGTAITGDSVYVISNDISDKIEAGTVTLQQTAIAPADTTPMTISTASDLHGLRSGQDLMLVSGGALGEHFAVVGATLSISGGTIGNDLQVAYSDVTISGGQVGDSNSMVGDFFAVYDGSNVTISGGHFGDRLQAFTGSSIDISGGGFDDGLCTWSGSSVTLHGDDFQLNGSSVSDVDAGVTANDLFTATLSDGTVVILSGREYRTTISDGVTSISTVVNAYDPIAADTTTLSTGSLGGIDTTPQYVSSGVGPRGLRPGQTLTLSGTGQLQDHFGLVNATLNIDGGTVGDYMRVAHGDIQMSDGLVDGRVFVYDGGTFAMTGGEVAQQINANYGGRVVISDGIVEKVYAYEGGDVQVNGGLIEYITIDEGGSLDMAGGETTYGVDVNSANASFSGGTIGSILSVSGSIQSPGHAVITGGEVSTVSSNGYANVELSDGFVTTVAKASGDSQIDITGGQIAKLRTENGGTINLYDAQILGDVSAQFAGVINIWGGDIAGEFQVRMGGTINLYVQQLMLDGELVDLTLDEPYIITERDSILLNAILSDGSLLDITLNAMPISGEDYFLPQSTLTVTLVPEPASLVLLSTGIGVLCLKRRSVC